MRTMTERTDPSEALERIAWYLNYHSGETLSLNQIAEATGLAWGTVQKYTNTLERIQELAPEISTGTEGISVGRNKEVMNDLLSDPAKGLAVYLFVHAKQNGDPSQPLEIADHEDTLSKAPEAVKKMESLGWIEREGGTIKLTPLGIQIAGPIYSEVRSGQRSEDVLRINRTQGEIRAVIEPSETSSSMGKTTQSFKEPGSTGYNENPYAEPYA